MAQEFLDGSNIIDIFQQMRGKSVVQKQRGLKVCRPTGLAIPAARAALRTAFCKLLSAPFLTSVGIFTG